MTMDIIKPAPERRFVTQQQLNELLAYYRMTGVGSTNWRPTRYGRILRAIEMYEERNDKLPGAYKDLTAAIEG